MNDGAGAPIWWSRSGCRDEKWSRCTYMVGPLGKGCEELHVGERPIRGKRQKQKEGIDKVAVHARFVCVRLLVLWCVALKLLSRCFSLFFITVLVCFCVGSLFVVVLLLHALYCSSSLCRCCCSCWCHAGLTLPVFRCGNNAAG